MFESFMIPRDLSVHPKQNVFKLFAESFQYSCTWPWTEMWNVYKWISFQILFVYGPLLLHQRMSHTAIVSRCDCGGYLFCQLTPLFSFHLCVVRQVQHGFLEIMGKIVWLCNLNLLRIDQGTFMLIRTTHWVNYY